VRSSGGKPSNVHTVMTGRKRRRHDLIEVRESRIQGRGVFALRRIRKGQRIIEYAGERITPEEVDRRYDDLAMDRHHTFLFEVDENTIIDGAVGGSAASYINHSCDPNCEAVDVDGRIFIYAARNIQPGVELTYDYQYDLDEALTEELKRRYPCHCRARRCRGTILVDKRRRRAG